MGPKTMWLTVKVSPGMFPSERIVKMRTDEGEVSLFVTKSQVKAGNRRGAGQMRVELLDSDENYGLVEIRDQHGPTVVKVRRDDLAEAA